MVILSSRDLPLGSLGERNGMEPGSHTPGFLYPSGAYRRNSFDLMALEWVPDPPVDRIAESQSQGICSLRRQEHSPKLREEGPPKTHRGTMPGFLTPA